MYQLLISSKYAIKRLLQKRGDDRQTWLRRPTIDLIAAKHCAIVVTTSFFLILASSVGTKKKMVDNGQPGVGVIFLSLLGCFGGSFHGDLGSNRPKKSQNTPNRDVRLPKSKETESLKTE